MSDFHFNVQFKTYPKLIGVCMYVTHILYKKNNEKSFLGGLGKRA